MLTWLLAAVIVLILAVAGGLISAWVVANMRAVPNPVAQATATPSAAATTPSPSSSAPPSEATTEAPRFTPTPAPTVEVTPEPFVHIVQRGESLITIATLYHVYVDDIVALNDIQNPNRIQPGQELLIPGYGTPPTPKPKKSPRG